jgi:hypothetical protein
MAGNRACINFSNPEFKATVEALEKAGIQNPFFIATKDFLQYGTYRNPYYILEDYADNVPKEEKLPDENMKIETVQDDLASIQDFLYPGLRNKDLSQYFTASGNNTARANSMVIDIVNRLSYQLGISYQLVTDKEAAEILGSRYTGQKSFFYNGKVYLNKDGLNTAMAFHEFSHVLVKALSVSNADLFEKLYNEALGTVISVETSMGIVEGTVEDIMKALYPDLKKGDLDYMEEVVTWALGKAAEYRRENRQSSLDSWVKELMFAIKQMLRQLFGKKIDISKLDPNTSLERLAEMLEEGGEFFISNTDVTTDEILEYREELRGIAEDIEKKVDKSVITGNIKDLADTFSRQLNLMKKYKYKEIANLLQDEYGKAYLDILNVKLKNLAAKLPAEVDALLALKGREDEIREKLDNLKGDYRGLINFLYEEGRLNEKRRDDYLTELAENEVEAENEIRGLISDFEKDINFAFQRAMAISETVEIVDMMASKMFEQLKTIVATVATSKDSRKEVQQAMTYAKILEYWDKAITDLYTELQMETGVSQEVLNHINKVKINIDRAFNQTKKVYRAGTVQVITSQLQYFQDQMDEVYERTKQHYENSTMSPENKARLIKRLTEDHQRASIRQYDPDTSTFKTLEESIEMFLDGKLGDAHALNSFLEGYMYNQDPIVAGFAAYVKENFIELNNLVQDKITAVIKDMEPTLAALGYNPVRIGELGDQILFADKVLYRNPDTNVFEEEEVWTVLNPNKDYRYEHAIRKDNLKKLEYEAQLTDDPAKWDAYNQAKIEHDKFMRKYFYQPFKDEVYKLDEQFFADTEIGRKAKQKKDYYLSKMYELKYSDDPADVEQRDIYRQQLNNLASLTDLNGNAKQGQALLIAKLMQDYNTASNKLYEYRTRNFAFNKAYLQARQEAVDIATSAVKPLKISKEAKEAEIELRVKEAMEKWVLENTTVELTPEFHEKRGEIYAKIKELLDKVQQAPEYLKKLEQLNDKKNKILRGKKNQGLQYDLGKFTADEIDELNLIDEEIKNLNYEEKFNEYGFTRAERAQLNMLYEEMEDLDNPASAAFTDISEAEAEKRKKELEKEIGEIKKRGKDRGGLSKKEGKQLQKLWKQYNDMFEVTPSEEYVDQFNYMLRTVQVTNPEYVQRYLDKLGLVDIDITTALEDDAYLEQQVGGLNLLMKNAEFKTWFNRTHIKTTYTDPTSGTEMVKYARRNIYNNKVPKDKSYMKSHEVVSKDDPAMASIMLEGRVPNRKWQFRTIKDEYRNEEIVGVTVDTRGAWLPKNLEDMQKTVADYPQDFAADEDPYRFINMQYYDIKQNNPELFAVIQKYTDHLLETQDGMGMRGKLYLDLPRFESGLYEKVTTKSTLKVNPITRIIQAIRDFLMNTKKAFEDGQNYKDEIDLVNLDMLDDEVTGVQISGVQFMKKDLVSKDAITSLFRYIQSAERQKYLIKMYPPALALQESLTKADGSPSGITDPNKVDKRSFLRKMYDSTAELKFFTKKTENIRLDTINNLIAREFHGETQAGYTKDMVRINKIADMLFARASFGYFAFNIPTAIKNALGQKFNAMLHAAGGGDYTYKELALGEAWGMKVSMMVTAKMYNKGDLPVELMLFESMDPGQSRTQKALGINNRLARTFARDLLSEGIIYNTREWLQLQAQAQIFGASLYGKKIFRYNDSGVKETITYADAWETKDMETTVKRGRGTETIMVKQLSLKEGIDPEYANRKVEIVFDSSVSKSELARKNGMTEDELDTRIQEYNNVSYSELKNGDKVVLGTSKLYKRFVNRQHDIQNKLAGAYAAWEQPEANRYLLFRAIAYLRKYFTRMFLYRFQYRGTILRPYGRMNIASGDLELGWYIAFVRGLIDTIRTRGEILQVMPKQEKLMMLRVLVEMMGLLTLGVMIPAALGWDEDDDDKYEKLRQKSGSMPFLFAPGDPDNPFNLIGFLENHALLMAISVRKENEVFLPLFGFGMDDYLGMVDIQSIVYGPTIEAYVKSAESVWKAITMDDSAFYKRKAGPYLWQDEGGFKGLKYVAGSLGFTGTTIDPVTALRNKLSAENR